MAKIDGKTRVYGIFGDPVRQTLSPIMYNALFEKAGFNAVYTAFEVKPDGIADAVAGIRALNFQGVHLTCPHKETAIPHLDRLSKKAREIGAINVILNSRGVLYGDNTDGRGFLRALQHRFDFMPEGKTIGILGAGGSARAIAHTLAEVGAKRFFVLNRTLARAERLVAALAEHAPQSPATGLPLEPAAFRDVSPALDLLIDATTPGADNPIDSLSTDLLPAHCIVSDVNYFRDDAPLLVRAAARGLRTQAGLEMLVQQGALSLMLLTGMQVKAEELEAFIRAREAQLREAGPG